MNTRVYDPNTKAYKITMESFVSMAMDQENPADRLNYKNMAMEAISGPDTGMVLDRLYKSVMSRASINFGKIPDSAGNLVKFSRYKTLADSITLLDKNLSEYNIMEVDLTKELHDTIIRCKEDFAYGFKVDSQFLKVTYNTMVYALCEMINLCDVIYIDMLKAGAEGKPFTYKGYGDLLLVQNVKKFIDMVKSGEWATMVNGIKKDARNLLDVVFGNQDVQDSSSVLGNLKAPVGIVGMWAAASMPGAKRIAGARVTAGMSSEEAAKAGALRFGDVTKAMGNLAGKAWNTIPGKVAAVVLIIIGCLFLARALVAMYQKAKYSLRDILDDNAKFLKYHIDNTESDPSGTSKSIEMQKSLYNKMAGLRDKIERSILADDEAGRKELKKSNATEFTPAAFKADQAAPAADSGDVVIG